MKSIKEMVAMKTSFFFELFQSIVYGLFLISDYSMWLAAHNPNKLLKQILVYLHSLIIGNDQPIHCNALTLAGSSKDTNQIFFRIFRSFLDE